MTNRRASALAGSAQIELVATLTDARSGNLLVTFEPKGLWAWGGATGVSRGISDLEKNVACEVTTYLQQSRGVVPTVPAD